MAVACTSGTDVRRLQLLAAAVDRGHPIGRLASKADAELEALIAASTAPRAVDEMQGDVALSTLLEALRAFDSAGVERELNRLSLALKPRELVHRVLFRFLKHVGDEWQSNRLTIAQEHLLLGAVRSLLGTMVRLYSKEDVPRRLLFATPSGERHEFGILAAAMLAAGGLGVGAIGADVPARLIVDSAARSGVDVVVVGLIYTGTAGRFAARSNTSSRICRVASSCRSEGHSRSKSAARWRAGQSSACPISTRSSVSSYGLARSPYQTSGR